MAEHNESSAALEWVVTCPVCGLDYCRPVAIAVVPADRQGQTAAPITADGVTFSTLPWPTDRGVVIEITMNGECGHTWKAAVQFADGQTVIRT